MSSYSSWKAIETALKDAAKKAARQHPGVKATSVDAQLRQARYDRFLSRVFAQGDQSEWLLKGGMSMLARVPTSRTTKDIDLAATEAGNLDEAVHALVQVAATDLGDHLTFELLTTRPAGGGDNQPGVLARRCIFACTDTDIGRLIDRIQVDLVISPPPVGAVEVLEPANRLHLGKPLTTHTYYVYPTVDRIADKVSATMSQYGADRLVSSRSKDLVDLVIFARTHTMDLDELRLAIATKTALARLPKFSRFQVPDAWEVSYLKDAQGVPGAQDLTAAEAEAYAAQLVDPALQKGGDKPATWIPGAGWTAPENIEATKAAVEADLAAGIDVYTRHYAHARWTIRT